MLVNVMVKIDPWKLTEVFSHKYCFLSSKMSESRMEFRLKNTPSDCIQSVKFGPSSSQFLLVASWDKSVRLYDVVNNNMRLQYQHTGPVLDCCFQVCCIEVP